MPTRLRKGDASLGSGKGTLPFFPPITNAGKGTLPFFPPITNAAAGSKKERKGSVPFFRVDAQFAWDEGEGDRSLAYWRAAHVGYFTRQAVARGYTFDDATKVVLERFSVVWPLEIADPD